MAKIMKIQPTGSKGDPRNGHGQSGWSPIGAISVVKVSQKFEHPKSTPYVALVFRKFCRLLMRGRCWSPLQILTGWGPQDS